MLGTSFTAVAATSVLRQPVPVPPPWAPAIIAIQGDSITSTTPNQAGGQNDFYSYYWKNQNPARTVFVQAQASRSVGGAAMNGDLAGTGSPYGNTLLLQVDNDLATGANLFHVKIGMNDLQTFQTATYKTRLATWAALIRSPERRIIYSPPTPMRVADPQNSNYAAYTARREALMADVRDPAVWGQWADYYSPLGEHPDFLTDSATLINPGPTDGIHPTAPVTNPATGQARLYASFAVIMASLLDATRANSTVMYEAGWLASESGLALATQITRRFFVQGIAHTGLTLGASVSGAGAEIRLNGGAWGTAVGTGSGNGYRIYNGDVIDLRVTTSAVGNTAVNVSLTVGSETRTISYTTVADVAPIALSNAGTALTTTDSTAVNHPNLTFGNGVAVVALTCYSVAGGTVDSAPASLTLTPVGGGAAITLTLRQKGGRAVSRAIAVYSGVVTAGNYDLTATRPASARTSYASFVTLENGDPVPVSTPAFIGTGSISDPHLAPSVTVPANGIGLGWLLKENSTTNTAGSGSTLINQGHAVAATGGTSIGLAAVQRDTTGQPAINSGFGNFSMGSMAFKAAGT